LISHTSPSSSAFAGHYFDVRLRQLFPAGHC
jgi:hypothetical protein